VARFRVAQPEARLNRRRRSHDPRIVGRASSGGRHRYSEAADGEEAFDTLERRATEIAALITDIRMPGKFNGFVLAQRVSERWPWISILVTSEITALARRLAQLAQFIAKPWKRRDARFR